MKGRSSFAVAGVPVAAMGGSRVDMVWVLGKLRMDYLETGNCEMERIRLGKVAWVG